MKTRYTIKNPGRGTGYRMPLINDDLRIQRTPYGSPGSDRKNGRNDAT